MVNLGLMFMHGKGLEKDIVKGIKLLELSHSLGNTHATKTLGDVKKKKYIYIFINIKKKIYIYKYIKLKKKKLDL